MQAVRTVVLITGTGLWNTWQDQSKVSCEDGIWRVLERFRAAKCFGRTESETCHCSSYLCPEQGSWETDKGGEWHFSTCSDQQANKPCVILSLSSPEASPGFWHSTQQRSLLTPSSPAASLPLPLPSSASRQCLQDMHTHTPWLLWSLFVLPWVSSNVPAKYESRAKIS